MKKVTVCALAAGLTLFWVSGTWAQALAVPATSTPMPAEGISHEGPLTIKGQVGMMFGDITYDTSGIEDGMPWASQLEFPLDMAVAGLDASLRWGSDMYYQQAVIGVRVMGNISDPVSDMIDRDWAPRNFLSTYTESDATLDALMVDAYIKIPFYVGRGMFLARNTAVDLVGEYSHQDFQYDIYGLSGYSDVPGAGGYETLYEPGSTYALKYGVTFDSVAFGGEITDSYGESFVFTGSLLGGLAWYQDKDDHILRSKISETDGVGIVVKVRGSSRYIFDAYSSGLMKWFVEGSADMTAIAVTGTQEQSFYDGSYGGTLHVDEDLTSIQITGTLGLGCMF